MIRNLPWFVHSVVWVVDGNKSVEKWKPLGDKEPFLFHILVILEGFGSFLKEEERREWKYWPKCKASKRDA